MLALLAEQAAASDMPSTTAGNVLGGEIIEVAGAADALNAVALPGVYLREPARIVSVDSPRQVAAVLRRPRRNIGTVLVED
jgi:hypothetical protein